MTTAAQIRAALKESVFESSSVLQVSSIAIFHPMQDASEKEISELYDGQQINAFECLVTQGSAEEMTGSEKKTFGIDISYYVTKDPDGANWIGALDALEVVLETINKKLGEYWSGLIDFWTWDPEPPRPEETDIAGEAAWKVTLKIQASTMQ